MFCIIYSDYRYFLQIIVIFVENKKFLTLVLISFFDLFEVGNEELIKKSSLDISKYLIRYLHFHCKRSFISNIKRILTF